MRVVIKYKHWKTQKVLSVSGELVHNNPQSERLVIRKEDGSLEDIIRETIIEMSPVL